MRFTSFSDCNMNENGHAIMEMDKCKSTAVVVQKRGPDKNSLNRYVKQPVII